MLLKGLVDNPDDDTALKGEEAYLLNSLNPLNYYGDTASKCCRCKSIEQAEFHGLNVDKFRFEAYPILG